MAKQTKKKRRRLKRGPRELIGGCLIVFSVLLLYSFALRVIGVMQQKQKYETLLVQQSNLQAEYGALSEEINLLENEDYVSRYARENYVFTQEGELPITIP